MEMLVLLPFSGIDDASATHHVPVACVSSVGLEWHVLFRLRQPRLQVQLYT